MQFDTSTTQFTLQGRTQPVVNSSATQLVALAFAMIREEQVQVCKAAVKCECDGRGDNRWSVGGYHLVVFIYNCLKIK